VEAAEGISGGDGDPSSRWTSGKPGRGSERTRAWRSFKVLRISYAPPAARRRPRRGGAWRASFPPERRVTRQRSKGSGSGA